jgi:hypothetical protein
MNAHIISSSLHSEKLLGIYPAHLHIDLSKNNFVFSRWYLVFGTAKGAALFCYSLFTNDYSLINGDDRARTDNLRLAKPALSQLSYVPGPNTIDY